MRKALCYQSLCYQLLLLLLSSMAQPLITSGAEEAQLLPNVTQYNCSTALLALNDLTTLNKAVGDWNTLEQ